MNTGIKTLTFAIVHFSVAFSVGFLLTGSVVLGSLLALVEPAVNTVAFYLHERVWSYVGRRGGGGAVGPAAPATRATRRLRRVRGPGSAGCALPA